MTRLDAVQKDVASFKALLSSLSGISPEEATTLATRFRKTLYYGDVYYFADVLGTGTYKICEELTSSYVIKFCIDTSYPSLQNEVSLANYLYSRLSQRIFLPAYYLPLSYNYFTSFTLSSSSSSTADPDPESDDFDYYSISSIIIQPRITATAKAYNIAHKIFFVNSSISSKKQEEKEKDELFQIISQEDLSYSDIDDRIWLDSVLQNYGPDFLHELIRTLRVERINDLHRENLGYIYLDEEEKKLPVIIDFCF